MRARSLPTRATAALLSAVFLTTSVVVPAPADIWTARRAAREQKAAAPQYASIGELPALAPVLSAAARAGSSLRPAAEENSLASGLSSDLRRLVAAVPPGRANIVEVAPAGNAAPVIILQDIHANAEAQANMAETLRALLASRAVNLVGIEGAFGPLDLSRFRSFADVATMRSVAEAFLKEGILGAPSFVGIADPGDWRLVGVDDPTLYADNARAVVEGEPIKARTLDGLASLQRRLDGVRKQIANPALLSFDSDRAAWAAGTLGLGDYLRRLAARQAPTEPVITDFLRAYQEEKAIDFQRVDAERRAAIEALARRLDTAALSALVNDSLAYRAGTLGLGDYYDRLRRACGRAGVDLARFPAFDRYVGYVLLTDRINPERLLAAIGGWENAVEARLAASPRELEVSRLTAQLGRASRLVSHALTPPEWKAYQRERSQWGDLAAAIAALDGGKDDSARLPLGSFESFYESAEARSRRMVDSLLAERASGARVLVTGGYHAPEIRALLAQRGVPVVTLSPRVSRVDGDPTAYLSLFTREKTPIDRLFSGDKLFLSPLSATPQDVVTANRLLTEATLDHAEKIPVGRSDQPEPGVTASHPSNGVTRAQVGAVDAYGTRDARRPWFLERVGRRVTGGFLWRPLAVIGTARALLARARNAPTRQERFARRFAWTESLLKAAALSLVLAKAAPTVLGSATLLSPAGIALVVASSLLLTTVWMGFHWLADFVRNLLTGRRAPRDWGAMWRGALALNGLGIAAVLSVAGLSIVLGQAPSPDTAYAVAHAFGHGLWNLAVAAPALLSVTAADDDYRNQPRAVEMRDEDFLGIDLEHFVHAQNRLADRLLTDDQRKAVLEALNLSQDLSADQAYPAIYEALADNHYEARVIDLINGDSYVNPRLDVAIGQQNKNPYAQSVYEAVANSLDALGLAIGQFGKGVKQAIDWLRPSGLDQIAVYTKREGQQAYMLLIRQDARGRNFIQIRRISDALFHLKLGVAAQKGTALEISVARGIPRRDVDETDGNRISQETIVDGVKTRFPFVMDANIIVHRAGQTPVDVNGYDRKTVIFPAGTEVHHGPADRNVAVDLNDHTILVSDNGRGMDAVTVSRMFVPSRGSKRPQPITGADAEAELAQVRVVHDPSMPHRMSFSRNGEVVVSVDIPPGVQPDAAVPGGLMVELGRLVEVPESRDNIILPLPARPTDRTNFANGVLHAIDGILAHPTLPLQERVAFVNTLALGLDGLIQGNANNAAAIAAIRAEIKKKLAPVLVQLREEGFVILPHDAAFGAIAAPDGRRILYLHPNLFSWAGAEGLRDLGGETVPDLTLDGDKKLPLVVVPFREDRLAHIRAFDRDWHNRDEEDRLPVIKTDRFVAIPRQLGERLLELSRRRRAGELSGDEQEELQSLVQSVNILTASEVRTSYEIGQARRNVEVDIKPVTMSQGELDSGAVNNFLTQPPQAEGRVATVPADANLRWVLRGGDVVDVHTGEVVRTGVTNLRYLDDGFVYLEGGADEGIYEVTADGFEKKYAGRWVISRGGTFGKAEGDDILDDVTLFSRDKAIDLSVFAQVVSQEAITVVSSADDGVVAVLYKNHENAFQAIVFRRAPSGDQYVETQRLPLFGNDYDRDSLALSKDGTFLIAHPSIDRRGVEPAGVINTRTGRTLYVKEADFDPRGRFMIARDQGRVVVGLPDGVLFNDKRVSFPVTRVAVTRDGQVLAMGDQPGEVVRARDGTAWTSALPDAAQDSRFVFKDGRLEEELGIGLLAEGPNGSAIAQGPDGALLMLPVHPGGGRPVSWVPLPANALSHDVVYDGRYFVLSEVNGAEVIYVDPASPDRPIVVKPGSGNRFVAQPPQELRDGFLIGATRPDVGATAPVPHLVVMTNGDATTTRFAPSVASFERVSGSLLRLVRGDGTANYLPNKSPIPDFPIYTDNAGGNEKIEAHRGDWIIVTMPDGRLQLMNTKTGQATIEAEKMEFLSSGRYVFAVAPDNGLTVYDLASGTPLEVYRAAGTRVAGVRPVRDADLIRVEGTDGMVVYHAFLMNGAHKEIEEPMNQDFILDDSGLFAYFPMWDSVMSMTDGTLYTQTGGFGFRTAMEGRYVYLDTGKPTVLKFDRQTGTHEELASPSADELPQFWRVWLVASTAAVWDRRNKLEVPSGQIDYNDIGESERAPRRLVGDFVVSPSGLWVFDIGTGESTGGLDRPVDEQLLLRTRILIENDHVAFFPPGNLPRTFAIQGHPLISQSKDAVVARSFDGRRIYLFAREENRDITSELPEGFVPVDVVGDTFIFANPANNELRYASVDALAVTTQIDPTAVQFWNEQVHPRRDALIARVRAVFEPLWSRAPAEFRAELEEVVRPEIAALYQADQRVIAERYLEAERDRSDINLENLPSDRLRRRAEELASRLDAFTAAYGDTVGQVEGALARNIWSSVFSSMFRALHDPSVPVEDLDPGMMLLVGLGFPLGNSEDMAGAAPLSRWVRRLIDEEHAPLATLVTLVSFLGAASRGDRREVVRRQVERMAEAPLAVQRQLLEAFRDVSLNDVLIPFLDGREDAYRGLGPVRPFAVFLTNAVDPVVERQDAELAGRDLYSSQEGVALSQIQLLEDMRPKTSGAGGELMSVDYLVDKLNADRQGIEKLPAESEFLEAEIRRNAEVQRESGAYTAELAQNAIDATRGRADGRLDVSFYRRSRGGEEEFVEEARDNGTGALQEIALDIPRSTKAAGAQMASGGFFGTGKYTIFEGVDRVEIVTNNGKRAYLFEYRVNRDANGKVLSIRKTRIRQITDPALPLGVTVRRIKRAANTVPELDQMLAQRAWKTFAGLAQTPNFTIRLTGADGKLEPLVVEHEILSEVPFTARGRTWGNFRTISAKDMPQQDIDRLGVRVSELKDEYLALVPRSLRRLFPQLGLIIQIPLPLIRNRSAFDHENEFLPAIQAYVAGEVYKSIARLVLTRTNPPFLFEGFPIDWETSNGYFGEISTAGNTGTAVTLANLLNEGDYAAAAPLLRDILPAPGQLDKQKLFVKMIMLLTVPTDPDKPNEKVSLMQRRLAVQAEVNAARAAYQATLVGQTAASADRVPDLAGKVAQARGMARISQLDLDAHRFVPSSGDERERLDRAMAFATGIARLFGLTDVVFLADKPGESLGFGGLFKGRTMYLNESFFGLRTGRVNTNETQHLPTDTVIHELAHLLEAYIESEPFDGRVIVDVSGFTHDAIGTFAEAMKYVAAVSLANHQPPAAAEASTGGNMEWLRLALNFGFRQVGLREISAPAYNLYGSWIAESLLLALIGGVLFFVAPAGTFDFPTMFRTLAVLFPFLHLPDLALSSNRRTLPARLLAATLISIAMLALPMTGASPKLLIVLAVVVHAAINAVMHRFSARPNAAARRAPTPRPVEDRAEAVRRIAGALGAFAAQAARAGRLTPGRTRVLERLLLALPDEQARVDDILGTPGRLNFARLVREPNFSESGFARELERAVRGEIKAGTLKPTDVLPLLHELADAGLPLEMLADVVPAALADNRKITLVVQSSDDESRVKSVLALVRQSLANGAGAASAVEIDIVAPAEQLADFNALRTAWLASVRGTSGSRPIFRVSAQPAGLISEGAVHLVRLASQGSLDHRLVMIPRGLVPDTTGLGDAVLRSLLLATLEDALSARVMTGETLSNLAAVAAVIARQA